MPRKFSVATMRLRAQQRCNMENDLSISTTEWAANLSEANGELYAEVANAGCRYFEFTVTFTTDTTGALAEPVDHLSTVDHLELVINPITGLLRRLTPLMPQERSRWSGRQGTPRVYEFVDDKLYLYPVPPAGKQIVLRYIAQPPDLTTFADTDLIDCVCPAGEAFLVIAAAVKALQKDQRDTTELRAEREQQRGLLAHWASKRAINDAPHRIVQYDTDDGDGMPWGWQ